MTYGRQGSTLNRKSHGSQHEPVLVGCRELHFLCRNIWRSNIVRGGDNFGSGVIIRVEATRGDSLKVEMVVCPRLVSWLNFLFFGVVYGC